MRLRPLQMATAGPRRTRRSQYLEHQEEEHSRSIPCQWPGMRSFHDALAFERQQTPLKANYLERPQRKPVFLLESSRLNDLM
jgi:hypothetical protein